MKIIYFTLDFSIHDLRFLTVLSKAGNEVYLLRLEASSNVNKDLPKGVKEIIWRPRGEKARWFQYRKYANELKKIIHEYQPDVIHAGPIQRVAYIAALIKFHPLISMSWGTDILKHADKNLFWKRITRFTLTKSDVFLCDCKAVSKKAQKIGLPKEKVVIFPWGVDLRLFSPGKEPALRKSLNWDRQFIIFSNRSWEPLYGVGELLQGFITALKKEPQLRLILAGTGSLKAQIHTTLTERNLHAFVHLPGMLKQKELPRYYRAADLYISASHSDGSSVSLLEAMACSKPVLVSDIPGNREWVKDGENGWLFPVGNFNELGKKIVEIGKEERLREYGIRNRSLVKKHADWEQGSHVLLKTYVVIKKRFGGKSKRQK